MKPNIDLKSYRVAQPIRMPGSIDSWNHKADRLAVAEIQKRHGAAGRLAAAEERRQRKASKRAKGAA